MTLRSLGFDISVMARRAALRQFRPRGMVLRSIALSLDGFLLHRFLRFGARVFCFRWRRRLVGLALFFVALRQWRRRLRSVPRRDGVVLVGRSVVERLFVDVQVFNVLPPEEEVGVDDVLGRDEGGRSRGVEELTAFGAVGADVFEGDGGVGFVDGVEGAVVADVLLRDQGDATPCGGTSGKRLARG